MTVMYKFHQDYLKQYPTGDITYTEPLGNPMWNKFMLANAITNYMGIDVEPGNHNIETDHENNKRIYYFVTTRPGFMEKIAHKPWGGYRGL